MYVASVAPLDKRSVDLFDAPNANDGAKLKFRELASNVHICSVEGHVVARAMQLNIVSLTKAMSFSWLTPLNCSALIPSILQAVQIRYMMHSSSLWFVLLNLTFLNLGAAVTSS